MTREELINQRATTCRHGGHCEWVACDKCNHYESDALSQQLCDDYISRQAVNEGFKKYANGSFAYGCVWDYINKLPSVTPKEKTSYCIDDKSKKTILNLYIELLEAFNGDKVALKKIDTIFEKPLEEVNS